jgi:hypothetical protein
MIQPTSVLPYSAVNCFVNPYGSQSFLVEECNSAVQGISCYYGTQRIITAITKSYHISNYYFKCNATKIFIEKSEGKRPHGNLKRR